VACVAGGHDGWLVGGGLVRLILILILSFVVYKIFMKSELVGWSVGWLGVAV
jgi:hypothetical protein